MNKGKYLIERSKELIGTIRFQREHRINEKDFSRKQKLPFVKLFAMILKLVKKRYQ